MFPSEFAISVLIDTQGEQIEIIKRTETTDDDNNVTFTYARTVDTYAWIRDVSGYIEIWDLPGYIKDIDLAGVFYWNEDIDIGDIVRRKNKKEYEVTQIIERQSGEDVDFKEVLMVGIE